MSGFVAFLLLREITSRKSVKNEQGDNNCQTQIDIEKFCSSFNERKLNLFHLIHRLAKWRPSMQVFASIMNVFNEIEIELENETRIILHSLPDLDFGSLIERCNTQLAPSCTFNPSSLSTFDSSSSSSSTNICLFTVFHDCLSKYLLDEAY